jgi:hypothetical protein
MRSTAPISELAPKSFPQNSLRKPNHEKAKELLQKNVPQNHPYRSKAGTFSII